MRTTMRFWNTLKKTDLTESPLTPFLKTNIDVKTDILKQCLLKPYFLFQNWVSFLNARNSKLAGNRDPVSTRIYSTWPPLLAMHLSALDLMSRMARLTIAGSSSATWSRMFCSSWSNVEGRGLYTLLLRYPHKKKSSGERSGDLGGHLRPLRHFLLMTRPWNWVSR